MKHKKQVLVVALGAVGMGASSLASAAALDRSGQSIDAFLRPGNYAEIGSSFLSPSVEGNDKDGRPTGDMASSYNFSGATIKLQPTENLSFGLLYDEPFGASASYNRPGAFVSSPTDAVLTGLPVVTGPSVISGGQLAAYGLNSGVEGHTNLEVTTRNLSFLVGYQPNSNWNLYGGPVYQQVKGNVSLRGSTYSVFNGYNLNIPTDSEWGWMAGAAYQIPEIALKVSLTYRSKIDYRAKADESAPLANSLGANSAQLSGLLQQLVASGQLAPGTGQAIGGALGNLRNGLDSGATEVNTPQSVNLDFQTGIMANTVLFGNVRWVDWSDFYVRPAAFGQLSEIVGPLVGQPNGFNLVDYSKDQWSANLGVGRKLSPSISGSVSVGWDNGAGNPVTTLGPTEGYWNLGVGARFSITENVDVTAGVKYFWLGDAEAETSARAYSGSFKDNNAIAAGIKLGVSF